MAAAAAHCTINGSEYATDNRLYTDGMLYLAQGDGGQRSAHRRAGRQPVEDQHPRQERRVKLAAINTTAAGMIGSAAWATDMVTQNPAFAQHWSC